MSITIGLFIMLISNNGNEQLLLVNEYKSMFECEAVMKEYTQHENVKLFCSDINLYKKSE